MIDNNINQRFDNVILNDKEIIVIKTTEFPESEIPFENYSPILIYESGMKLWDNYLKAILDNSKYSEAAKIQFIRDALADTSRDQFQYINSRAIDFWRSSKEAQELINNYFSKKQFENSDDPELKYKYFEFKTKSLYPEAPQLIADYFARRPQLPIKYRHEMDLLIRLKLMGKEEDAVKYLELIVDDVIHNRLKNEGYGSRSSDLTQGCVFDHLCLSENETIARKATDILFNLLYQKKEGVYWDQFCQLLKYVDKERSYQVLDKWYAFYAGLDFSAIDLNELKTKGWYEASKKVPGAVQYYSFMSLYAAYFGEKYGKKFWKDLISKAAYIQQGNNSFGNQQVWTIETVLKNKTVTTTDLKEMLFQVIKTPDLFRSDNKTRYLLLIIKAYPDKKIPKADFDKLQLEKIYSYAFPLNIPEEDLRLPIYWNNLNEVQINRLVADINEFSRENNMKALFFNKMQKFLLTVDGTPGSIIYDHFNASKVLIGFNTKTAGSPANYISLYNAELKEILENKNYKNFKLSQVTKRVNDEEYSYRIYTKYNNSIYKLEYTDRSSDFENARRLIKMINLCLIENNAKERIILTSFLGQSFTYLFMEPAKAKPFLDKYKIRSQALNYNDAFADMHNK